MDQQNPGRQGRWPGSGERSPSPAEAAEEAFSFGASALDQSGRPTLCKAVRLGTGT